MSIQTTITWTRYDGTPETLPENKRHLMVVLVTGYYTANPGEVLMGWTDADGYISVQPWEESPEGCLRLEDGDLWAYWPAVALPSDDEDSEELFYLQASGYVGNDFLWWRQGRDGSKGSGYTAHLDEASTWTRAEAEEQLRLHPHHGDTMWPKPYIDARAHRAVDHQYVDSKEISHG